MLASSQHKQTVSAVSFARPSARIASSSIGRHRSAGFNDRRRVMERKRFVGACLWIACVVLVPASVHAQSSIAGVVKDTTGAVLPGVTVEAASPALIEKVKTSITDGTGQFRIVDLRPGT